MGGAQRRALPDRVGVGERGRYAGPGSPDAVRDVAGRRAEVVTALWKGWPRTPVRPAGGGPTTGSSPPPTPTTSRWSRTPSRCASTRPCSSPALAKASAWRSPDLPGGGITVRDSKNPSRPALCFTTEEWSALRKGMIDGSPVGPADHTEKGRIPQSIAGGCGHCRTDVPTPGPPLLLTRATAGVLIRPLRRSFRGAW
ncbi:DUF397 domain-containing protein [Streptomyces sp. NPDC054775]